ncbi:hypothetical protein E9536_40750 [Burkholderia sp. LS-044]|uniref:hypothetical protein n=1 Tax=Burkholderia sp. LS-044 TaxID=1459967 RepID=UPI0010A65469|nr:hypothetical protein [Burkholderia sp. LS-044]THJ45674.1 hypothetical protein E9536_40750 [Burkholderia sp. LS-044]
MASIVLSEVPLANLKKLSRETFPAIKSSHLTEALASALGFRTHASLLAALVVPATDADIVLLDELPFRQRLSDLGYKVPEKFSFEDFIEVRWGTDKKTGRAKKVNVERPHAHETTLISTVCKNGSPVKYESARARAWRNLLVSAVNAALEHKLFTFRPGDNRWPKEPYGEHRFEFTLANGMPGAGFVRDVGYDELVVYATAEPTDGPVRWDSERQAGSATGFVFLERSRGAWLQSAEGTFHGTRPATASLAEMSVAPHGYGDRGQVIM